MTATGSSGDEAASSTARSDEASGRFIWHLLTVYALGIEDRCIEAKKRGRYSQQFPLLSRAITLSVSVSTRVTSSQASTPTLKASRPLPVKV
jgi:hypothetical protein